MDSGLAVLHEDGHILAVNKPAGMAIQGRDPAGPSLEQVVRSYLSPHDPAGVYLGTVHRLDRPVTGVVLWAKTPRAARRLADQFAARTVEKQYEAIVPGPVIPPAGVWTHWLFEDNTGLGIVQICRPDTPRARQAVTCFETLDTRDSPHGPLSRLRLFPKTGRTHQLRAQCATHGCPIVGDLAYGSTTPFPDGIALHARSIEVRHPSTGEPLRVEAAFPAAWHELSLGSGGPT